MKVKCIECKGECTTTGEIQKKGRFEGGDMIAVTDPCEWCAGKGEYDLFEKYHEEYDVIVTALQKIKTHEELSNEELSKFINELKKSL